MPSESSLQEEGAGSGLAWAGREGGTARTASRRGGWGGRLPGNVADERLGQVPGEVVGTELRLACYSGPGIFCRGP